MRLAATISPMRGAERRIATMAGTLRSAPDRPEDVAILDISRTGLLVEMPEAVTVEPGTRVRIAASPIGSHVAIAVRHEGRRHGFVFARPLAADMLARIGGDAASNVVPFVEGGNVAVGGSGAVRRTARSSLTIAVGAAVGLWSALAALLLATARFA